MPITNSGWRRGARTAAPQTWAPGALVRVGFMQLRVVGFRPTPGDGLPDVYECESLDGTRKYDFTPHRGVERVQ